MTKIEEVARAIREAELSNGECDEETTWLSYVPAAIAAVRAMREPNEAMLRAKMAVDFVADNEPDDIAEWHAAIDAALAEHK